MSKLVAAPDQLASLQLRLEDLLEKKNAENVERYSEYRVVIQEIAVALSLPQSQFPLFPERSHGAACRKALYEAQGKPYDGKPTTQQVRIIVAAGTSSRTLCIRSPCTGAKQKSARGFPQE